MSGAYAIASRGTSCFIMTVATVRAQGFMNCWDATVALYNVTAMQLTNSPNG